MGDFFFVIKTLLLTIVIVMLLQIKIGPTTLEQKSLNWMRESNAVHALRGVAEGATVAIDEGVAWVSKLVRSESASSRREESGSNKKRDKLDWDDEF